MRLLSFAKRNIKEIFRDPITLGFGLGFPVILLLLLTAIQANIPVSLFELPYLTPGIMVFGLSFISLFSATLIAKDRESAFFQRLYTSPMTSADFILGYALPFLPVSVAQCIVCYISAMILGLEITASMLLAMLFVIPVAILFIGLGLLFGSILTYKQVGAICGSILTNLTAWLSGIWFDLELVGGAFERIAFLLPFAHAVEMERAIFAGNLSSALPHLLWVTVYAVAIFAAAILLFLRQMKRQ